MKIGDKVRIISIPPDLSEGKLRTKSLFELWAGKTFPIVGLEDDLIELHVGELRGKEPFTHSIWIEREHVQLVNDR